MRLFRRNPVCRPLNGEKLSVQSLITKQPMDGEEERELEVTVRFNYYGRTSQGLKWLLRLLQELRQLSGGGPTVYYQGKQVFDDGTKILEWQPDDQVPVHTNGAGS